MYDDTDPTRPPLRRGDPPGHAAPMTDEDDPAADEPEWIAAERREAFAALFAEIVEHDLPSPANHDHRLIPAGSFILDGSDDYEPLWGSREQIAWAEGESMWICGPQGVAKSTLMQQLALRRHGVLVGDLLGMPVATTDERGLYLAMDRPNQIKRSLRRMVGEEHRRLLDDRLTVWKGPPPHDVAKQPQVLLSLALEADATTIYIDSLKDAAVGLSDDEVGAGFNRAVQYALAEGVDVTGAHHQRKGQQGGPKPKTLDDVYGSTWITSGAGSVVLLWGKAGDIVMELEHLKPPSEPVGPFKAIVDFATGNITVEDEVDLYELACRSRGSLTAEGAARALFLKTEPDRNDIEKARRRLNRHPMIEAVEGPAPAGGGKPTTFFRAITQQSRTPSENGQSPLPVDDHGEAA